MCHLDTVGGREPKPITLKIAEEVVGTDGKTVLGADDRAGLTVLLWMVRQGVPGLYCAFVGEEQGCIGSRIAAEDVSRWEGIDKAVSFDRTGYGSIITHQCSARTASEEFAEALSAAGAEFGLKWKPDDTGVFTDSEVFTDLIAECTNVSVGYFGAHSNQERQDLDYLEKLCWTCCAIDWEGLPVARVPGTYEDLDWRTESRSYGGEWGDAWDRVEMDLMTGQAPDAKDLSEIVREDSQAAADLIGMYLKEGG